MEPIVIRAHQLKPADKFRRQGLLYSVKEIDETGVYYFQSEHGRVNPPRISCHHFGPASKEYIELIERSNFN